MFIEIIDFTVEFEQLLVRLSTSFFLSWNYLAHAHMHTPPEQSPKEVHHFPHNTRKRKWKVHIIETNPQHCRYRLLVMEEGCPGPCKPEKQVKTAVQNPLVNGDLRRHLPVKYKQHPVVSTLSVGITTFKSTSFPVLTWFPYVSSLRYMTLLSGKTGFIFCNFF